MTDRLTSWNEDCVRINGHALSYATKCELVRMAERLAAYEDTGLSPKGCAQAAEADRLMEASGLPMERIVELLKAEIAGRCVVLPCKVGDTVYQLRKKTHASGVGISPRIVSSACIWADGSYALTHQGMLYCQSEDLGKTWFLTREEAEKALEERVLALVHRQPAADVAPVEHARWLTDKWPNWPHRECSRCRIFIPVTAEVPGQYWQYCPNCGARMDGAERSEA